MVFGRLGEVWGTRSWGEPEDMRLTGMLEVETFKGVDSVEDMLTIERLLLSASDGEAGRAGLALPKPGVEKDGSFRTRRA